eukprot:776005-Rhodomonas_salina.2
MTMLKQGEGREGAREGRGGGRGARSEERGRGGEHDLSRAFPPSLSHTNMHTCLRAHAAASVRRVLRSAGSLQVFGVDVSCPSACTM